MSSLLRYGRYVRFPLICCAIGLVAIFASHGGLSPAGLQATWITLVLLALEISLSFELPPRLDTVRGDRDKITLALHNLIGNALKYTPAGGEVKVVVQQTPAQLSIAVTDNGIGIKTEECELIFDRFYRAKDKRLTGITGSGLGLALARQIARLHEGDVTVRSALDKGSTFTLVLPTQERGTVTARAA